jgi:NAD(P)-dependent dehydrogenase (short-subunit alcohol dehydrogenase family)
MAKQSPFGAAETNTLPAENAGGVSPAAKKAVITGATGGLGLAMKKRFERAGYTVVSLSDRNPENIPGNILCDVTDEASLAAAMRRAAEGGGIDALICNAGRGIMGAAAELDAEAVRGILDLNVTGAFLTMKHGLKYMKKGGRIVCVSSASALFPLPYRGVYCASKAALHLLALSCDMEFKKQGVRVTSVCPGEINTTFTANRLIQKTEGSVHFGSLARLEEDFVRKQGTRMDKDFAANRIYKLATAKRHKPFVIIGGKYKFFYLCGRLIPYRLFHRLIQKKYDA